MQWEYALQFDSSGLTEPYMHNGEHWLAPAKRILIEAIETWLQETEKTWESELRS